MIRFPEWHTAGSIVSEAIKETQPRCLEWTHDGEPCELVVRNNRLVLKLGDDWHILGATDGIKAA